MDDFYTPDELRAIDTAGRQTAASLQKLREHDEANSRARETRIPWTALAGSWTSETPTNKGATS